MELELETSLLQTVVDALRDSSVDDLLDAFVDNLGEAPRVDDLRESSVRRRVSLSPRGKAVLLVGLADDEADRLEDAFDREGIAAPRAASLSEAFDILEHVAREPEARWPGAPIGVVCGLTKDPEAGVSAVSVIAAHQATRELPIVAVSDDPDARIAALRGGATAGVPARARAESVAAQLLALCAATDRMAPAEEEEEDDEDDVDTLERPALSGSRAAVSVETLATILGLERQSGVLELFGESAARIDLVAGHAVRAEIDGEACDAVDALVVAMYRCSTFAFSALPLVGAIEAAPRLDGLAIDAARLRDEQLMKAFAKSA
ncbi:MAG TPA: hypothetical protein VGM56_10765 [Byssovorax sp.]